jgi:hypothetical protein
VEVSVSLLSISDYNNDRVLVGVPKEPILGQTLSNILYQFVHLRNWY